MSIDRALDPARRAARVRAARLWLCATIVGLLVAFAGVPETGFRALKAKLREHPASGRVVVVGIDDKSLAALGQWPLPRSTYARLIDRLFEAGAKDVYLTLNFPTPQSPAQDAALAAAARAHRGHVFLSTRFTVDETTGMKVAQRPIEVLGQSSRLVNTNFPLDENGSLSHQPYGVTIHGERFDSIAAQVAGVFASTDDFFPLDVTIIPRSIPIVSMIDVLQHVPGPSLRNKQVIIGLATDQVPDSNIMRPYGRIPNSVAYALGAETLMSGSPNDLGWLPSFAGASLVVLLGSFALSTRRRAVVFSLSVVATPFVPALLSTGTWLSIAPSFALLLTAATSAIVAAVRESLRARATVNQISGLLNLAALRQLATQPDRRLVVAQVHNYAEVTAALPDNNEAALIGQIASRLKLGMTETELYHGDNGVFVWFARDPVEEVGERLDGLHAMFRSPVKIETGNVDLVVTFGVDSGSERTIANRLGSALVASTEAAANGAKWREFDKAKLADAAWKLSLLSQLDTAIDEGDLWVAYQPKLSLADRRIIGAEALVRWTHPEKGAISPIEFVAAAEQHNRIEKLTMHVLDRAVLAAATINAHGIPFGIAVNLSTRLLESRDIVGAVVSALKTHGLPASQLTLEITETATLSSDDSLAVLGELRDLGVRISIDDYGTGLSTLDYLKRIPASEIKIDKSFVQSILGGGSDLLMVNSTIQLAHSLGHVVVAEGVETDEVLARLIDLQCDIAQGYRIGRPMTFQDLARRLLAERRHAA